MNSYNTEMSRTCLVWTCSDVTLNYDITRWDISVVFLCMCVFYTTIQAVYRYFVCGRAKQVNYIGIATLEKMVATVCHTFQPISNVTTYIQCRS